MNELLKFYAEQNGILGTNPDWNKMIEFGVSLAETNRKQAYDYFVATGVIGQDLEFNKKVEQLLNLIETKEDHNFNPIINQPTRYPSKEIPLVTPSKTGSYSGFEIFKCIGSGMNIIATLWICWILGTQGGVINISATVLLLLSGTMIYLFYTLPLWKKTLTKR